MTYDPTEYPDIVTFVPDNVLTQIGIITVAFSYMEDELNAFISDLLGTRMTAGQAVTFKIRNITDRLELAINLAKISIKFDDHKERALSVLEEVGTVNTRRNMLIHHAIRQITYNVDAELHELQFQRKDHRLREPVITKLKAGELRVLATDIRRLARDLSIVANSHRVACGRPTRQP